MSFKEFTKIKIHEFRLIKTLEPMGFRRYLLMTKYNGEYKSLGERTALMWSASLIHEMAANENSVPFEKLFITNLAELKNLLRNASKNAENMGISFKFVHHDLLDKPEWNIAGRFITSLSERLCENSMTIEAYAVLGQKLFAYYEKDSSDSWGEDKELWTSKVYKSGEPYIWDRLSKEEPIINLHFDHLGTDTIEMLNKDHLEKARKTTDEKGYVIAVKWGRKICYVSGIRNKKGAEDNLFLLNLDVDMAIGFASEDEALETILSLDEELCQNFEVKCKRSQFFSIYENPPSVLRT